MSVTRAQILAEIPDDLFRQALYSGGIEVSGLLDQLIYNAGFVSGASDDAAQLALVCDAIYRRARIEPAKNPWAARAAALRQRGALPISATGASGGTGLIQADELEFSPQDGL